MLFTKCVQQFFIQQSKKHTHIHTQYRLYDRNDANSNYTNVLDDVNKVIVHYCIKDV